MGTIVAANIPLLPDYVQIQSMGLANGYSQIVTVLSNIASNYGMYQLSDVVKDPAHVYYGIGAATILMGLLIIFGIRDVIAEPLLIENKKLSRT